MGGKRIKKWDEKSCELIDGTVLDADLVYVCFGGSASSSNLISSSLDDRKGVVVNANLQVKESNMFSCGDIASPPTEARSQAFHAEVQGIVAARNIIRKETSDQRGLIRYPDDICGSKRMPLVYVLSLGKYDGILGFNQLVITGPLSAVFK